MHITYKILKQFEQKIWDLRYLKNYLRITHEYDNEIILHYLQSAIEKVTFITGMQINTKSISAVIPNVESKIRLRYIPIFKIHSIKLIRDDKTTTIEPSTIQIGDNYEININDSTLYGQKISIIYDAGFGNKIPYIIKTGILLMLSELYDAGGKELDKKCYKYFASYRQFKI